MVLLARTVDDLELGLSTCVGPDIRDPLSIGTEAQVGSARDGRNSRSRPTLASHRSPGKSARALLRLAMRCRASPISKRSPPNVAEASKHSARCGLPMSPTAMARCCGIGGPNSRRPSFGTLRRAGSLRRRIISPPSGGVRPSIRSFRDLFARKDFLVAPAASVFPWNNDTGDVTRIDDVGPRNADRLSRGHLYRLAGWLSRCSPCRRRERPDQKPFGVQIIAAPGQESKLFAFGRRIEEQLGFCHRRPPI